MSPGPSQSPALAVKLVAGLFLPQPLSTASGGRRVTQPPLILSSSEFPWRNGASFLG